MSFTSVARDELSTKEHSFFPKYSSSRSLYLSDKYLSLDVSIIGKVFSAELSVSSRHKFNINKVEMNTKSCITVHFVSGFNS